MSRNIYSSLDDAFQPLNPQQQATFHSNRINQEKETQKMWATNACNRDFTEIHDRMNQGQELPPYCSKENDKFREFQRKSNQEREDYLKNIDKTPRSQLSNNYQDVELGMYRLGDKSSSSSTDLVKVPNNQRVFLEKRLEDLEKELKKYQFLLRVFDEEDRNKSLPKLTNGEEEEFEEHFGNIMQKSSNSNSKSDEIIDLIVLLGIGLLIIFVLDSVFKMGKSFNKK